MTATVRSPEVLLLNSLDDRPDPEDGAHTPAIWIAFRCCDLALALLYMTALPWWQPALWFATTFCTGTLRWIAANRPAFAARPLPERRRSYRLWTWIHMAALGSACVYCYVPGDMLMLTLLGVHLFGAATVAALRLSADFLRNAVAVALIIGPTALRTMTEGVLEQNTLKFLMGVGGVFMIVTVVLASRFHERSLDQQSEQRWQAERAADAIASVGLAKSRFFAAVSHDLRQPVHAIGLYLDPLVRLSQASGDVAAQRAVEGIRQSWRALDGLLSQVLDLTRMDAGVLQPQLEPVELAATVRSIIVRHSAAAERAGVRLVMLGQGERLAQGDQLMVERIVSNLVDNAIKFSHRGGTVAVALRPAAGGWRIQVRDGGRGIPLEAQARVFEEFVQIDNDARDRRLGYGLGLAISRRFAHLMQGDLTVRSAPGRGCCMTVTLPRASAPEARAVHADSGFGEAAQEQAVPPESLPVLDILLVEDDRLVATAMRRLLQSWGQRVVHVETGSEAVACAAGAQVAICDVRLPRGESGLDVALRLRAIGKKVLLITGETDGELRRSAADHGVPLLVKPVSSSRLLGALSELVH